MKYSIQHTLLSWGLSSHDTQFLVRNGQTFGLLFLSMIAYFLVRKPVLLLWTRSLSRSKKEWSLLLIHPPFLKQLTHLIPALILYFFLPFTMKRHPHLLSRILDILLIYMIIRVVLATHSFLNTFFKQYQNAKRFQDIPFKGTLQVLLIVLYSVASILILSILLDKNPFYLLSGLGALTAVGVVLFKDALLGFMAGIQLMVNDMIHRGDWIEMPKYGADGEVLEIALTTVKIQNWDKTITMIPTYSLISESFKNWRGMTEAGLRRIKRSLFIDMTTVHFCDDTSLVKWSKIRLLSSYLEQKQLEITQYNQEYALNSQSLLNGRRLTNLGTFRAYVQNYLQNHPMMDQNSPLVVRLLEPTDHGIPLEIYVFCKEYQTSVYEKIQSDIFDHILSAMSEFDLHVFQHPSGYHFQQNRLDSLSA